MRLIFLIGIAITWHVDHCATEFLSPPTIAQESAVDGTEIIRKVPEEFHQLYDIYGVNRREKFFSKKFFKVMVEHFRKGNAIFSPFPVSYGLWMLAEGARGNTAEQLKSALISEDDDVIDDRRYEEFFAIERNVLRWVPYIRYSQVFYRDDLSINPFYERVINTKFQSIIRTYEKCHPARASETINKWVEFGTHNYEKEIFHPDIIIPNTALNLVSWFGFRGYWSKSFDVAQTTNRHFYHNFSTYENVPTMTIDGCYRFGKMPGINAHYIVIPYQASVNTTAAMIIVLPDKIDGLKEVEDNFQEMNDFEIMYRTSYRNVRLYLPKLNFTKSYTLNEPLRNMGLTDMFSEAANFSFINETTPIRVGIVEQKVSIEINEYGTWPLGHNEISVMRDDEVPKPEIEELVTFDVNHPFIFIIRTSGHTNIHLITGRYTQWNMTWT